MLFLLLHIRDSMISQPSENLGDLAFGSGGGSEIALVAIAAKAT